MYSKRISLLEYIHIIEATVSTKSETLFTAFCIAFLVLALFVPIDALAAATTEPTAIATPIPFITLAVFFFI